MKIQELLEQMDPVPALKSYPETWQAFLEAESRLGVALDSLDQGVYIFRGVGGTTSSVRFKPQMHAGYRKSANTYNYYTLLIDNDPAWSAYPPRSASVIASTNHDYARNYGSLYLLLPEGNPQVGVCSQEDFWESFPHMTQQLNAPGEISNVDDLNLAIRDAANKILDERSLRATDHEQLIESLELIQDYYNKLGAQERARLDLWDSTRALLDYQPGMSMGKKLSDLLDPQKNNFAVAKWNQMDAYSHGNYEVWFSANTWMIHVTELPFVTGYKFTKKQIMDYARSQAQA